MAGRRGRLVIHEHPLRLVLASMGLRASPAAATTSARLVSGQAPIARSVSLAGRRYSRRQYFGLRAAGINPEDEPLVVSELMASVSGARIGMRHRRVRHRDARGCQNIIPDVSGNGEPYFRGIPGSCWTLLEVKVVPAAGLELAT